MAKFTSGEAALLLTPRLVGDGVWREICGGPVEDTVRKIPDILVYLLCKYPIVTHWLFVETIKETITQVVELDGELKEIPISEGMAVQLIGKARQVGLFEEVRPEGAATNLLYFFTEEQKAKLLRIRRVETLGYALCLEQAKNPNDPTAGRTPANEHWYRHPNDLIGRKDSEWEKTMSRLSKLLRVIGLCVVITITSALAGTVLMTHASLTVTAGDLSGTVK